METIGPEAEFVSLLVVALAAFAVPLLLGLIPRTPIPGIVGEVVAGILLGSSFAGLIEIGPALDFLFLFGLAFLLFLAGLEIDFVLLRRSLSSGVAEVARSPVGLGFAGMAGRLVISFAIVAGLRWAGLVDHVALIAILLTSTSLGVVLAVLKERGLAGGLYGQVVIVSAAVADFATVFLLTVFFSSQDRSPAAQVFLVLMLAALGVLVLATLRVLSKPRHLHGLLERLSGNTTQIRIRGTFALLLAFVALSSRLGLELILGAFVAGALASVLSPHATHAQFRARVDTVGYSFFVPVFFVITGARLDVQALLASSEDLALVPVLLAAILLVKVIPSLLYRVHFSLRESVGAGSLQSAQLTLTVAGVEIGKRLGLIDDAGEALLILVALLTVLIGPLGFSLAVPPRRAGAAASADPTILGSIETVDHEAGRAGDRDRDR